MKILICTIALFMSIVSYGQKADTELSQTQVVLEIQREMNSPKKVTFTPNSASNSDRAVNNPSNLNVLRLTLSRIANPVLTPVKYEKNTDPTRLSSVEDLQIQSSSLQMSAVRPKIIATPTFEKQEK